MSTNEPTNNKNKDHKISNGMPKEIANKTKENIHPIREPAVSNGASCKCKKIWIDGCLPVGRVACPSEASAKEGEDYACPVVSFALLLGSGLVAMRETIR